MVNWQIKKVMDKILKEEFDNKKLISSDELVRAVEILVSGKYNKRHENRGHDVFRGFVNYLFNRAVQNYDNMVLVSGDKGTGKSNAGIMLARAWCSLMGTRFDPQKNIVYTNKQLLEVVDSCPPWSVILCDEAINFATAENWNKPENKEIKIKLGTIRTKHIFFILAIPWKIKKLDKVYFDSYINYWIHLFSRGDSAVYVKDNNPSGDPWKLKNFEDLGAYNEFTSREQIKRKLQKHPNFWSLMKIPKTPQKVYDAYLKVRESNVYNNDDVLSSVDKKSGAIALMLKALYDITLKGSTFSIKRLKKHFEEKYKVVIPIKLMQSIFDDSEKLCERLIHDGGIEGLKK